MRSAEEKAIKLEVEVQNLTNLVNQRNAQIQDLRRQLELKSEAIDKIKLQSSIANLPEMKEILRVLVIEDGLAYQGTLKGQLASLEREITRLKGKNGGLGELEGAVESWIMGLPNDSSLRLKVQQGGLRIQED